MNQRVNSEMEDILKYLADTEELIKTQGTLGTSTLNVQTIIDSQFADEELAYRGDNYDINFFTEDSLGDILNYFKDSFVETL